MSPAVSLRPWTLSDLDKLVAYANNPKIADNLTDHFPHPYSVEAGRKFLDQVISQQPAQVLAIYKGEELCGSIGIFPQQDIFRLNAELGYWLAEPFWGHGIATEAIRLMCKYGFETFKVNRIFARPFGRNKASQRALEKAGFKLEASFSETIIKNGKMEDELIYAYRKK